LSTVCIESRIDLDRAWSFTPLTSGGHRATATLLTLIESERESVTVVGRARAHLLEDLRQGKEGAADQAMKELQRLEELIKEMMEKLSQMSSHRMEEFINVDALKNLADVELAYDPQVMLGDGKFSVFQNIG